MTQKLSARPVLIVTLRGYIGNDTSLEVSPDPMFMVVDAESGAELDNGYRSFKEAWKAWPNALNRPHGARRPAKAKAEPKTPLVAESPLVEAVGLLERAATALTNLDSATDGGALDRALGKDARLREDLWDFLEESERHGSSRRGG